MEKVIPTVGTFCRFSEIGIYKFWKFGDFRELLIFVIFRLSRNWISCYKMLESTPCLQPDPKPLEAKKSDVGLRDTIRKELPVYKNHEDWISMHRPYKTHCLLSKAAYGFNPFALFG